MNKQQLETIKLYSFGKMSKEEFINSFFEDHKLLPLPETIELLDRAYNHCNVEQLQIGMIIISLGDYHDMILSETLCKLLLETWHFNHEDIALTLAEIKDPNSVKCLSKAVDIEFDYLSYDDTFQLARKCIKALSAINTYESKNSLESIGTNPNRVISGYARKELLKLNSQTSTMNN